MTQSHLNTGGKKSFTQRGQNLKQINIAKYVSKFLIGGAMMIILHGDTIEQLTYFLSEFRAALAVTNLGRGSRQPHTEQL